MTQGRIPGVSWGNVERRADSRGSFRELWRASNEPENAFVQANVSISAAGVLRGLHVHRRQVDRWIVTAGRAFVALVDLRRVLGGSDGAADRTLDIAVETREVEADTTITIPAGVAHGFLALEPLELIYLVTNEFDGSDEHGFAWDDPAAGVPWPAVEATADGRPILSDRDQSSPSLAELVRALKADPNAPRR